jgi:hypothetical protein
MAQPWYVHGPPPRASTGGTAIGAIVTIAEFVLANEFASKRGPDLRPDGWAIPPGEETQKETREAP